MRTPPRNPVPLRLLVVCPSWLGDVVMATPALRLLRATLKGSYIGALLRPGMDELLAGADLVDEVHVDRAQGVMGPKMVASKLRPRRYDTALLLTNSFSTALVTRLAFIPRRVGYDRDGRGILLTDRIKPLRTERGFTCISAVDYYLRAAMVVLGQEDESAPVSRHAPHASPQPKLELGLTPAQAQGATAILARAGIGDHDRFAVLNPGANDASKRWPAERFGAVGRHLAERGLRVLVNGSPAEAELVREVAAVAPAAMTDLAGFGGTIGTLKGIIRRAALLVTNDTGPRHIAAAFGVPTITLFGPTDPRWTTLPDDGTPRRDLPADPTLPPDEIADDHPERCRIDRIALETVLRAVDELAPERAPAAGNS